jgi:HEAT repeat protein
VDGSETWKVDMTHARILLSFSLSFILGASSAAVAIGDLGPGARAAVPALIEALRDPNATVRFQAAISLGCIGPEARAAVPALIGTLKDGVFFVRGWSAFALGEIGPEAAQAVPMLAEGLKNAQEREFVRRQIASALGRIGPNAVSALVEGLTNGSELARLGAVLALQQVGPAAALRSIDVGVK